MNWYLGFGGIVCLVIGLIGQAFEMRNIRMASENETGSPTMFTDKANFKWYGIIGAGIVLWYAAERL
ncbi:MAG: hypothetical protein F4W68_01810 [Cenarchaeum sp. SB0661_bin_35]|nr:hypothetical protein [Cenarchaeum sp. SB0661_bin_35]MYD58161.1 hypothetical protein [Cenarchaeum sp. SB0678_bin_8]